MPGRPAYCTASGLLCLCLTQCGCPHVQQCVSKLQVLPPLLHQSGAADSGSAAHHAPCAEARAPQNCVEGIITANSKWGDIQAAFGAAERATLHARSFQAGPHNPSYVVGYRGVAFEVTKAGYIASATLFMA